MMKSRGMGAIVKAKMPGKQKKFADGGNVGGRDFVGTGFSDFDEKDIVEIASLYRKNDLPKGFRTLKEREAYGLPNSRMEKLQDEEYRLVTPSRGSRR